MRMEELQMLAPTTFPQTSQINLSLVAAKASSTSEKRKDHCKKQMIGREKRKDQVQMVLHSRKASQKDLPSILLWLKLHQMVHVIIIVIIFTIIINLIAVIIIIIIVITVVDLSSSSSSYKEECSSGKITAIFYWYITSHNINTHPSKLCDWDFDLYNLQRWSKHIVTISWHLQICQTPF